MITLPPFKAFLASNIPSVYDNTLSYYDELTKLIAYMEELVPAVNENTAGLAALKEYVDHYFDNLNIQQEINNKLDAMAESGELVEIIGAYLNFHTAYYFDTLTDLKDSSNLIAGSIAKTKGCTSVNDNGGATYYIRDKEEGEATDNYKVIAYGDSLVAVLVIGEATTPEMYGAVGDGQTDDTAALRLCLLDGSGVKNFKKGATYKITNQLNISTLSNVVINGNNSTIFAQNGGICFYCYAWNTSISDIEINNLTMDGDRTNATYSNTAFCQFSCGNAKSIENIHLVNCTFQNVNASSLGLYNDNVARSAINYTKNVVLEKCVFTNIAGVGVQSSNYSARIVNCFFDGTGSEAITIDNGCEDYVVDGCRFENYHGGAGCIGTDESKNVRIVNNMFDGSGMNDPYGPALSINSNTGINYNMDIIGNNFTNNKYAIAVAPHYTADFVKCVEGLTIIGNTFQSSDISDIVIYKYGSGSKIAIKGNTMTGGNITGVDCRMTTNINEIKYDGTLPLTTTAGEGFTLVKNNSKFIEGVLYIDALVAQSDATLSGWKPVLNFNINTAYKENFELQCDSTYNPVGPLDAQLNGSSYQIFIPSDRLNYFAIKKQINI